MIGFFEHQYLSYKKSHIQNLLALAKVDGHVHDKEEKLLFRIGKRYGLKERQVREIIRNKEKYKVIIPDNHYDKMNVLYDLLLMIFADQVVDKHEIDFFEDAVKTFGMKKEMAKWLIDIFETQGKPLAGEWEEIAKEAQQRFVIK